MMRSVLPPEARVHPVLTYGSAGAPVLPMASRVAAG